MRRLMLILLLVLVPLQGSWAVVAHSFEHHDLIGVSDEVTVDHAGGDPSERAGGSLPSGHDHCHLAGFVGITASFIAVALLASQPFSTDIDSRYRSRSVRPPERPQWPTLA